MSDGILWINVYAQSQTKVWSNREAALASIVEDERTYGSYSHTIRLNTAQGTATKYRLKPWRGFTSADDEDDAPPVKPVFGPALSPAKFDPKKSVQCSSGRGARILCTDAPGDYPIVALVEQPDGAWYPFTFTKYGHRPSGLRLVNVPVKRTFWLNVYENGDVYRCSCRAAADAIKRPHRIACLEITYTEGEGLSQE